MCKMGTENLPGNKWSNRHVDHAQPPNAVDLEVGIDTGVGRSLPHLDSTAHMPRAVQVGFEVCLKPNVRTCHFTVLMGRHGILPAALRRSISQASRRYAVSSLVELELGRNGEARAWTQSRCVDRMDEIVIWDQ